MTTTDRHTIFALARMAGCGDPDTPDSPGARFLTSVADAASEHWYAYGPDGADDDDAVHEIADGIVPVYTHELWLTFVDLAAYREDDDTGIMADALSHGHADLDKVAGIALYQIAERLLRAELAEHAESAAMFADDDDDDAELDDDEPRDDDAVGAR